MTLHQLKLATVKQLKETREAMLEWDYLVALEKLPAADRRRAALQLSQVQLAYLRLRAARMADIREGLDANRVELQTGIRELRRALGQARRVGGVLRAVEKVLTAVERILPAP